MARRSKEYLRTIHTRYRQAERAEKTMMSLIVVRVQGETNGGRVLAWHAHAGLIPSS